MQFSLHEFKSPYTVLFKNTNIRSVNTNKDVSVNIKTQLIELILEIHLELQICYSTEFNILNSMKSSKYQFEGFLIWNSSKYEFEVFLIWNTFSCTETKFC